MKLKELLNYLYPREIDRKLAKFRINIKTCS